MYLKRKVYDQLLDWKNDTVHSTLEVNGARQVGKTYIINKLRMRTSGTRSTLTCLICPANNLWNVTKKPQTGLPVQNDRSSRFTMLLTLRSGF